MEKPGQRKILFVDDDEHTLRIVADYLGGEGYKVITSSLPFIGPLIDREEPELLILDIDMPLITGDRLSAILESNESYRAIPVIFFSGQPEASIARLAHRVGAAGYVPKEKGLPALLRGIKKVLP